MTIKQLSIFVENRTGKLVECMKVLADAKIDIRAMSIADTQDFGILRLVVSDTEAAKLKLRDNGFVVKVNQVVGISIPDTAGSLCSVVGLLSDNGINIEYMYAFITVSKHNAYVVLRVEDNEKCVELLNKNNIKTVSTQDIENIYKN